MVKTIVWQRFFMTDSNTPSKNSSSSEENKELRAALDQVVNSLINKVKSHPKGTLVISTISLVLNFFLTPTVVKEYLPKTKEEKFFNTDIGSQIYCEERKSLNPATGLVPMEFSSVPPEAKFLAEGYVGRLGLCIKGVQREQLDGSYEVLLTDRISSGNLLVEMDIVKVGDAYKIEEFEKKLTWQFVQQEKALDILEAKITEKCRLPQNALIELSERDPHRIPGSVLQDENVFYEFECDSKDGGTREYILKNNDKKLEESFGSPS